MSDASDSQITLQGVEVIIGSRGGNSSGMKQTRGLNRFMSVLLKVNIKQGEILNCHESGGEDALATLIKQTAWIFGRFEEYRITTVPRGLQVRGFQCV